MKGRVKITFPRVDFIMRNRMYVAKRMNTGDNVDRFVYVWATWWISLKGGFIEIESKTRINLAKTNLIILLRFGI